MAAFAYRAIDPKGRNSKGIIEAANAAAARSALRGRKLLPVSVEPTATPHSKVGKAQTGRTAISQRALTLLTRQLATLIGSGIGVEQALRTVADQTQVPRVSALLLNLRSAVLDGRSFAQALGDYPGIFDDSYRASVAAGENAGKLDQVMEHLSGFVETRAAWFYTARNVGVIGASALKRQPHKLAPTLNGRPIVQLKLGLDRHSKISIKSGCSARIYCSCCSKLCSTS